MFFSCRLKIDYIIIVRVYVEVEWNEGFWFWTEGLFHKKLLTSCHDMTASIRFNCRQTCVPSYYSRYRRLARARVSAYVTEIKHCMQDCSTRGSGTCSSAQRQQRRCLKYLADASITSQIRILSFTRQQRRKQMVPTRHLSGQGASHEFVILEKEYLLNNLKI